MDTTANPLPSVSEDQVLPAPPDQRATTLASPLQDKDPRARRRLITLASAAVAMLAVSVLSLTQGSVALSWQELWAGLFAEDVTVATKIVWTLRLPRLLLGLLVGVSLALSGVLLQAVMQNPLADPGIIGVSAGGGLVAVTLLLLFPHASGWLPAAAALGGLGAALSIYALAWREGTVSPLRVILAGVAVNAFLASLMTLLMLLYSERVPAVLGWMAGSLSGRSWSLNSAMRKG